MKNRRSKDAIIRNGQPLKQMKLPTRKLPPKDTVITVKYTEKDLDKLDHVKEIIEGCGLKARFVKIDE